MKLPYFIVLFSLLFILGCDLGKPKGGYAPMPPVVEKPVPAPNNQANAEPAADETVRVKADVGAGKKGHYGEHEEEKPTGIITVPVSTLFRAKEATVFRIQIPQAMQLYKAMNDNEAPKTHEEFMEKIINANQIVLPELPAGQKYIYDPKVSEELMVEKKR
jgi:hypothetical protein